MFVPNYNYSNPLNYMQIVDFINFYNPNIINPYIKLLPNIVCGGLYHCVMIGLDGSGKTTILYRLKYGQYINTSPTIGFNCEKVRKETNIHSPMT